MDLDGFRLDSEKLKVGPNQDSSWIGCENMCKQRDVSASCLLDILLSVGLPNEPGRGHDLTGLYTCIHLKEINIPSKRDVPQYTHALI
jgi:hypothetical protein